MEEVLRLEGISKQYTLATQRPVLLKNLFWPSKKERFWALKNIDLAVKKGEVLGIIGENGSGKSTLLKILAGITTPTGGKMQVKGRVASLIELGAGFHPDLTGRENIYLNAALMGLTRAEINLKIKDIIIFADIGEFIDSPVRTYSSGMVIRLGFSVAINLDADILLIDEVLAVGDEEFQRKSMLKFKELIGEKKTILLVSHNLNLVRQLCRKIIWVNHNSIFFQGSPEKVIGKYLNNIEVDFVQDKQSSYKNNDELNKKVAITNIEVLSGNFIKSTTFKQSGKLVIKIEYYNKLKIDYAKFGVVFFSAYGEYLYGQLSKSIKLSKNKGILYFIVPKLNLLKGKYFITIAVADTKLERNFDWKEQKVFFEILAYKKNEQFGSIALDGVFKTEI